jgi:hypothetical protein
MHDGFFLARKRLLKVQIPSATFSLAWVLVLEELVEFLSSFCLKSKVAEANSLCASAV